MQDIITALLVFAQYSTLWRANPDDELKAFLANDPHVSDFENKIKSYEQVSAEINARPEFLSVGPLAIFTGTVRSLRMITSCVSSILSLEQVKFALNREIRDWINQFGHACNAKYRKEMNAVIQFIDNVEKRLSREIKDLEDIRLIMFAVKDLRENEILMEKNIAPIEESYSMLPLHGLDISREEIERADTLRYRWTKLQRRCVS